ncbi:MAG TPA: GntR family transcriptional regulator [Intrasporangiaceae bacterium]|nr:GntR family transcriptional regulator [Intrasporangiaceae bacterium]
MLIRIHESSEVPIYRQIADGVRRELAQGRLQAGDRLPPARDLAEGLGVNIHTVLRGYQELQEDGLITLRRGRGAVVAEGAAPAAHLQEAVAAFAAAARQAGLSGAEAARLVEKSMS